MWFPETIQCPLEERNVAAKISQEIKAWTEKGHEQITKNREQSTKNKPNAIREAGQGHT